MTTTSRIQLLFARNICLAASAICLHALAAAAAESPTATSVTNPPPDPPATVSASTVARPKSQNVTINLIHRLVERGVLSSEDAAELIQQAEKDAAEAKAEAAKLPPESMSKDTVTVPYIPEIVKAQIREEVEANLLKQAKEENWFAPNTVPSWVARFNVTGDVRMRYDGLFFPAGNDTSGVFPNFNAINTGQPFDTTGVSYPPERNVDEDRNRFRLMARLGCTVNLDYGFSSGIRIATGENNSPVSPNQSLGAANQSQGGNFSKYAIWLDRAYIKYEWGGLPSKNLELFVGRFDNPFFETPIIWDNDLGFDGFALQGKMAVADGVVPFVAAGAFPFFNTDLNFSSNRPDKYPSSDKWLFGGQIGADWKINRDFSFKGACAYYCFYGAEGKLSDPFVPLTAQDQGNTDNTRPAFAQYGNTYMALRDITPTAANDFGNKNQWQYYGLATPFQDLTFTGKLDYNHFEPFIVSLFGSFVWNLAYDANEINAIAVNNRGPDKQNGDPGAYVGGDIGWITGIKLGSAALQKRWDWNIWLDYRYVESDAVIDGFCESDFGGGGTNLKGYSIGGALALTPRILLALRWMSAEEIAGPTLKANVLQADISARW
jgi:hypothetical protein